MSTAGPAHRVQSAVIEYGYPQGHLGHLTPEEEAAFKNFKVLCAEKGYYTPANDDRIESHDDATLLRFLRARRFIVLDAFKQFQETEDWRKANELDKLYETIDLAHYEETRRLYPQWTGRRDRRGIPVYVFEVKHLNSKTMSAYEKSAVKTKTQAKNDGKTSPKLMRLFALYENLTRFVMPLCTAMGDREWAKTPITQSNNIVDISGVGLKQFWNLRTHMQDASTLATAHYPETLDRIFIIGAPSFFPTVWGWVKKWFDPITTSKIFILSASDTKKTLESFIDPANIPKKYGGQLEFEFGDMPVLDAAAFGENIKWNGDLKDFPHGPMYWINKKGEKVEGMEVEEEETIQAIAAGTTESGTQRSQEVCTLRRNVLTKTATTQGQNGTATEPAPTSVLRPDLLSAPTEVEGVPTANVTSEPSVEASTTPSVPAPAIVQPEESAKQAETAAAPVYDSEKMEVHDGELVPASRPEPVSFVTASEGIKTLSLDEKKPDVPPLPAMNGTTANPHASAPAPAPAPAVNVV
ncbi:CRAL/TRIO domain-containing protein [Phlyctema vagabunda]|uniref:CRAL/TRIO domain-containing protein n=1 Tax=Phlyctema vagabunda TaxID=108571 RepID=A0ABR4P9M2_9HELO